MTAKVHLNVSTDLNKIVFDFASTHRHRLVNDIDMVWYINKNKILKVFRLQCKYIRVIRYESY